MNLPIKHPFATAPRTTMRHDANGRSVCVINARALTPLRAKFADFLATTVVGGTIAACLYEVDMTMPQADWQFLAAMFAPMLTYPVLALGFGWFLRKRRKIVISADRFSFRTLTGWKHYDRTLPHKFSLYQHDKAMAEAFDNELAERQASAKGQIIKKKAYYGQSYHLVFEYVGQRIDVMDIYTQKEAERILSRLHACDAVVDASLGQGKGTALAPKDDWADVPGALPE